MPVISRMKSKVIRHPLNADVKKGSSSFMGCSKARLLLVLLLIGVAPILFWLVARTFEEPFRIIGLTQLGTVPSGASQQW